MGWAVGLDSRRQRDIGYGVPSLCDHPGCDRRIDRGLGYVCGGESYGGNAGCGLFFCGDHRKFREDADQPLCARCRADQEPFEPTADLPEWVQHKLTDDSWDEWRRLHPEIVARLTEHPA